MSFEKPGWLAAGALACVMLAWLWHRYDARQRAALARFVSPNARTQITHSMSAAKRRLQRASLLLALAMLFAALAGPLVGYRWEEISRRGNEIVFAVDTSRSMDTPDMKPSRLTRAKLAIDDFANRLEGDAVGIVAFAGSAFLVCPITLDYGAFHESLNAIDTATIPRGGTNISSAIQEAQAALRRRPASDKILVLVTDGEDLEGSALATAQAAAAADGLKIYTVGVGSASGDLIPLPAEQGGGFVKDAAGEFVKSRLDETALQAIAAATGGFYVPLGTQGEGLETIFTRVLGPLAKHNLASRQQKVYTQRYQWPLAAALFALLTGLLIGTRRSGARTRALPSMAAALLLTLPCVLAMRPAQAAVPGTAEFNAGTAAYQAGQFPQAARAFQESIGHAPSGDAKRLATQQDAYYNLGNTLYRNGQKTEKSAPQETLKQWTNAVKAYDTALQLRAQDGDSKFNRDFVQRKIDALKQAQDQQQSGNKGQPQGASQNKGPNEPPRSAAQQPAAPAPGAPDRPSEEAARAADNQRQPGQMSREEARELLDSVKSDERRAQGSPLARRDGADDFPEKPYKNW